MPRKALSKSRKSRPLAKRKAKPATPRHVILKSSSWYASAARAIAISGVTRMEMQKGG